MRSARYYLAVATVLALAACANGNQGSSVSSNATASGPKNGGGTSNGTNVFQTNCSSCHGATGEGTPGAFPPLAGNSVVVGNAQNVMHIVKDGLHGSISVKGQTYNGMMPAWGGQLSNADIAAAITFIRSSWGIKRAR